MKDKKLVDPATLPESVTKDLFDKTASQLAEAKKQLKAKSTTDEQAAAKQQEIQDQLTSLQKENSQFKFEKEFLANGYDAKTAGSLAEAVAAGDMKKFAEVHTAYEKQHETDLQASIKAQLLKETPGLQGGGAGDPGDNKPSLGEKAAQAYNSQFAQVQTTPAGAPQGK